MNSPASVKARLKYYAQREGRIVQEIFTIYVLEKVLYRLSVSRFVENFILKGGILLYGLFDTKNNRTTSDIDLLGNEVTNDNEQIRIIFSEILKIESDDGLFFDLDSLTSITEQDKYHGVRVVVKAYLEKTRISVHIDIGYGDIVYPRKLKMTYPSLLGDESPELYAYSIESIVLEKFEAIVSLGKVNSRYKDFYDIFVLSRKFDFDGRILREALVKTFSNRKTTFNEISVFDERYIRELNHKTRWRGFIKSKNINENVEFEGVIESIKHFLLPVVNAIKQDDDYNLFWSSEKQSWQEVMKQ